MNACRLIEFLRADYRQDWLGIFNDSNPSGNITTSALYGHTILVGVIVSVLVGLKRVWMGYHIGRRIFCK
jgi:hypothetical protein